jgi:phosphonate transport system substrate-binding protein
MDRADAEAFAVTSRPTRPGEPGYPEAWINGYYSFIIARTDSGIYRIDDLPGRTFGFVDPASTSGMVVPANDLLNHFGDSHPHLNFETLQVGGQFFSSTMFTGTHANSVQGVLNGDVEAATVASGQWTAQINAGLFTPDDMRIIHSSEQIPGSPFAFYRGLPEDLKDLVRDFFLGWDNQEFWDIRGMGGDSRSRYMPVDDSAYDIIRELRDRFNLSD